MTDEERKMLYETHELTTRMYTQLFETPMGASKDTASLVQSLRRLVTAYERGSWAARALVWVLPTIVSMGVAIAMGWDKVRAAIKVLGQ